MLNYIHMLADQTLALKLLTAIAARDEAALMNFHAQFANLVFSVARRTLNSTVDAEEVTQDVFLTLWRKAAQYDPAKGNVVSWLFTMTRRRAIDYLRGHRGDDTKASPLEAFDNQVSVSVTNQTSDIDLQRALFDLPTEQREVLDLIYFGGFTQDETARKLALPLGTVKSRVRLALTKLRATMNNPEQSKAFQALVFLGMV